MSRTTDALDPVTAAYVRTAALSREGDVLARLREATAKLPDARMQISVEQGRLMSLLAKMLGVRRALEVGVFTGYSALCVAENLPPDGVLVACDVSEEWTAIAREFWEEAGVADRIDLRLGQAADILDHLLAEGEAGTYDFAFIDADKQGYGGYYEQCLALLREGGVLAIDNIFMHGRAIDPDPEAEGPVIVNALTEWIGADDRVDPSLVPVGDGLMLARKR